MVEEDTTKVNCPEPAPYLEVTCGTSGKARRFAAGTKAGFAVNLINRKLNTRTSCVSYIEAVKEGEEPISFGPDAVLVDYGNGWRLQTVSEVDSAGVGVGVPLIPEQIPGVRRSNGTRRTERFAKQEISPMYIGKILLAFLMMFVLGAIFTIALENLPRLVLFINSYL